MPFQSGKKLGPFIHAAPTFLGCGGQPSRVLDRSDDLATRGVVGLLGSAKCRLIAFKWQPLLDQEDIRCNLAQGELIGLFWETLYRVRIVDVSRLRCPCVNIL